MKQTLIGKFDKKELIKVIGILVKASDEAEQKLLDYCQANATEQNKSLIVEKQLKQHWKNSSVYRRHYITGDGVVMMLRGVVGKK